MAIYGVKFHQFRTLLATNKEIRMRSTTKCLKWLPTISDWFVLFTSCLMYKGLPNIKIYLESKLHTSASSLDFLDLSLGIGAASVQIAVAKLWLVNRGGSLLKRAFASGHPKVTATCFTVSLAGLMLSCTAFHLLFALICYFTIGEHFFWKKRGKWL